MLDKLTLDDFQPLVEDTFSVRAGDQATDFRLVAAQPMGEGRSNGKRAPFALTFQAPPEVSPVQGLYRLEHEELGTLEVFLVPVAGDQEGTDFEAVFN